MPGPAGLDLQLQEVAPLEEAREAVDEREQRGVGRRDRGGDRIGRGGGQGHVAATGSPGAAEALVDAGIARDVVGHPSHRVKTRALFWPPKPNELLTATRIGRSRATLGVRSSPAAASSGSSQVDRRRDDAVAQAQDRGHRLDRAGRAEGVAQHALVGRHADLAGAGAEEPAEHLQLRPVALRRRGGVGVHVLHVVEA